MRFGKIWYKTDKQFSKAELCFQTFENRSCSLPCQHLSLSVVLILTILVVFYDTLFCISGDQWCKESLTRFYWSLASSFDVNVQFSPHLYEVDLLLNSDLFMELMRWFSGKVIRPEWFQFDSWASAGGKKEPASTHRLTSDLHTCAIAHADPP